MSDPADPVESRIRSWVRDHRTPGEPQFDTDAAWTRFQAANGVNRGRPAGYGRRLAVLRIAALLMIAAGAADYYRMERAAANPPAIRIERVAANGERITITLEDGSRITLKGGSRLRYPAGGPRDDREFYLDGEAFFEVHHDRRRTFRVYAGRGVIQDIGTRFNVRAYADQPNLEVAVAEGSVYLAGGTSKARSLVLEAGDVGVLGETGPPSKSKPASLNQIVGWTTGSLVFDNVPLRDVARELERWYGGRIVVADTAIGSRLVVARFRGETIGQALDAISLALGVTYEKQRATYTIHSGTK